MLSERSALLLSLALSTAACGPLASMPDADLSDPDATSSLGRMADPTVQHAIASSLMDEGVFVIEEGDACPRVTEQEDGTVVLVGGCMTRTDLALQGTMTIDRDPETHLGTASLDGWGSEVLVACGGEEIPFTTRMDGEVELTGEGHFGVDLVMTMTEFEDEASCDVAERTFAMRYEGVATTSETTSVVRGSGRIGDDRFGEADAEASGVTWDLNGCPEAPTTGSITLAAGGREAVLTYDESSCDVEPHVAWTLDGEDQGRLALGCSATATPLAWTSLFGGLGLLLLRRRRKDRS